MAQNLNIPVNANLANAAQLTNHIHKAAQAGAKNINVQFGANSLNSLARPLGKLSGQADDFSKSLQASNARVLAFGASVGIINLLSNAFKGLIDSTRVVEKAIKDISVINSDFAKNTGELSDKIFEAAKKTGQSFEVAATAALEFSRQGLSMEETIKRTTDALILTRLTGLDAADAVKSLTAAVNGFSDSGLNTTQIINKLIAVDQQFAVSARDLVEGISRSGSVAQDAGLDIDELIGTITALQQLTARGGPVIGNAFKTILTRIGRTGVIEQLKNAGVEVLNVKGQVASSLELLKNLADRRNELSSGQKSKITEAVGGGFQINQLTALLKDYSAESSVATKATETSRAANNQAARANEELNKTLDSLIAKTKTSATQLGSTLGNVGFGDNLKTTVNAIEGVINTINNLLGVKEGQGLGSSFAQGIAKGIGDVLTGPGLFAIAAIALKLLKDLVVFGVKGTAAFFGITTKAKEQKSVQDSIVDTLLRNRDIQNQIVNFQGSQVDKANLLLRITREQIAANEALANIAAFSAPVLIKAGIRSPGGKGFANKAAGGYLPSQEAAAIKKGVGGASPSSKIAIIPNFNFGGGKKGTMVANTSEYLVPNFNGSGGTAVFNQDMLKTMGMPMGAKRVGAAGGYVPPLSVGGGLRNNKGKFVKGQNIESILDPMIRSLVDLGASALEINQKIREASKTLGFADKSINKIATAGGDFANELKVKKAALQSQLSASFGGGARIENERASVAASIAARERARVAFQANVARDQANRASLATLHSTDKEKPKASISDTALKVFVIQSIASFVGGSLGTLEGSVGKVAQSLSKLTGDLTTVGFVLPQLSEVAGKGGVAGALGKLGIAGTVALGAFQAFSTLRDITKELSGENERTATAVASLAEASKGAAIRLDSLSESGQKQTELLAKKSLEKTDLKSIFGTTFGGKVGDDSNVQKTAEALLAQGVSTSELEKILNSSKKLVTSETKGYFAGASGMSSAFRGEKIVYDKTEVSDVLDALKNALLGGGIGNARGQQLKEFKAQLSAGEINTKKLPSSEDLARKVFNIPEGEKVDKNQINAVREALKLQSEITAKKKEAADEDARGFGKRISLDIATAQVDAAFALKKLKLETLAPEEQNLKFQLQAAEISNVEKQNIENKLSLIELEKKARIEMLDIVAKTTDEIKSAPNQFNLEGIEASRVSGIASSVGKLDFNDPDSLSKGIASIAADFGVDTKQIEVIAELFKARLEISKEQTEEQRKQLELISKSAIVVAQEIQSREKLLAVSKATASLNLAKINANISSSENRASAFENQANNPALGIRESEGLRQQATNIRINEVAKLKADAIIADTAAKRIELDKDKKTNPAYRTQLNELNLEEKTRLDSLRSETEALKENAKYIGETKSALVSYGDALLQFERNLGESQGQNRFNLLQATDASSISGGLIAEQSYGAASGKSGEDLVRFLAQENALRQEKFKIATAASQAEKLALEIQLELTQELLEIQNKSLDPAEKQLAVEEAINRNLAKRRTFSYGVKEARAGIKDEVNSFGSDFGKTATNGFRDALVGAMDAATSATGNLRDALLSVALDFANSLKKAALQNLANIIVSGGGSGGGGASGLIGAAITGIGNLFGGNKKATGGYISGGSGNKDDVPTLLMGGEYVIPKNIVQEHGRGFFDALRNGSVGKMAQGGYFAPGVRGQGAITGKENLLDFATQTATSGGQDVISSLSGGAGVVSLEPESLRLSNFNRFGDSPIVEATQEAKDQAFGLYLDQLNQEKEYREQQEAAKKAQKAQKKAFLMSLATAAVTAGLTYGLGKLNFGGAAKGLVSGGSSTIKSASLRPYIPGVSFSNATSASKGLSNTSGLLDFGSDGGYRPYSSGANGMKYGLSSPPPIKSSSGPISMFDFIGVGTNGRAYRNSGGSISGNGDTVPAMLSNKEFVLNASAANRIGDRGLHALNSGFSPSGGQGSNDEIVAKLDELIQKTIGASNVNVTVNTGGESNTKDSSKETQDDSDSSKNQRLLAQKIKDTVLNVIREEQRPGGILTRR